MPPCLRGIQRLGPIPVACERGEVAQRAFALRKEGRWLRISEKHNQLVSREEDLCGKGKNSS